MLQLRTPMLKGLPLQASAANSLSKTSHSQTKVIYLLSCLFLIPFLFSCTTSGYEQFYTPYNDAGRLPNVDLLQPGREPEIFGSNNMQRDIQVLRSKQYIPIGQSSFNGGYEDTKKAAAQAKKVGATIVITNSEYTNTQTSTLFIPSSQSQTTYHSGTIQTGAIHTGSISNTRNYGSYTGSTTAQGSYSGSSTTYTNVVTPVVVNQRRYDQTAVYFVKSNKKLKLGVLLIDLTPELRNKYDRNTGALVDVVIENTPAFYANLLEGDLIIDVNGNSVRNFKHAMQLFDTAFQNGNNKATFRVVRGGTEKDVPINLE